MFSNFKKRLGVLTAIAVMAALVPALSVSTASAAPATAASGGHMDLAELATYSACPASASVASAGFTDTTSTDVDCIAMYGITTGVTATTYEPASSVPRWQMALYLTRTASVAGSTLGSGADQGFTDISGYSAAIQTAINQLKQLGVTTGTTATTYSPDDNVTREQMAMFVERLLARTGVGVGGEADADALGLTLYINSSDVGTGKYNYDDIDTGAVTFEGHNAINEIYALGITGDAKTVRAFNPATNIDRATMATWLTNALGHTNTRPAGITMQGSAYSGFDNTPVAIHVSNRDSAFVPIVGTVIDVFDWTNAAAIGNTAAFSATTGKCNLTYTSMVGSSLTECTVDAGDMATDSKGNLPAFNSNAVTNAKTDSIWAWSAAAGTAFVNTTHLADAATIDVTNTTGATNVTLAANVNALATTASFISQARHATSVTITAQMATAAYVPVAQAGKGITFTHIIKNNDASVTLSQTTTVVATDAAGTATYTFTQADPTASQNVTDGRTHTVKVGNNTTVATAAVTPAAITLPQLALVGLLGADGGTLANDFDTDHTLGVDFSDDTRANDRVSVAHNATEGLAAASSLAAYAISRSVTATVTDQFGAAITGDTVTFAGSGDLGVLSVHETGEVITTSAGNDLVDGSQVRFLDITGCTISAHTIDTTFYVDWISATTFALASAVGLTPLVEVQTTDAACGAAVLVMEHHNFDAVDRVVGSNGSASFAWNDTATTSAIEPVCAMDVNGGTTFTAGCKNYSRYLNPSGADLAGGLTDLTWVHSTAATDGTSEAGVPLVIDMAAQTVLISIDDEQAMAAGGPGNEVVVLKYAWDSNDHFQVDGTAVPYSTWAVWMTLHSASEAEGDIISLAGYQVLPGNVSLWNIKGS
jgi:hypothetical protein